MLALQRQLKPLINLTGDIIDLVFPQTCAACGSWIAGKGPILCSACHERLNHCLAIRYCHHCGRSMRPEAIHERGCARCLHEAYWNLAQVVRLGPYESPLREMIIGLKYRGHERNAAFFAEMLAERMRPLQWHPQIDALIPVPMHWLRRMQRPCAHAAVLAEALGRRLGIPVKQLASRRRYAPSQTNAPSRNERFKNVDGCFVAKPRAAGQLAGRTVCIVDNLLMSGATICELSTVLRKAGAKRIYAVIIARTIAAGDFQADSAAFASGAQGVTDY